MSVMTALREANQVGVLQPTTLVAYRASIWNLFDTRDEAALSATGMSEADLADPSWRDRMRQQGEAPSQKFGRQLYQQGYIGLIIRSFAKGSLPSDLNVVLWRWGTAGSEVDLVDDDDRLRLN